jgi:phosphoglycolate phosphatase-like HAD superfamily hydrolase
MGPTVLLFDIDGTLLLTGGAGRRSFEHAFQEVCGRGDACAHFSFAGMTDQAIAREGLRQAGLEVTPERIAQLIDAYLARLASEVAASETYAIMPGVERALAAVATERDVAIGLGTGNVKRGAFVKLARGGLDGHFGFGGFGCDAEDRAELLLRGAERGAAQLRAPLAACRVVVIGDTVRDVAAARAIGATCIGVGTGGVAPAVLREAGARYAFDTLESDDAIGALLAD